MQNNFSGCMYSTQGELVCQQANIKKDESKKVHEIKNIKNVENFKGGVHASATTTGKSKKR